MQTRIQIGVEEFVNGERKLRLTPIDQNLKVSDSVIATLKMVVSVLDQNDPQPGDGELDVKVDKAHIPFLPDAVKAFLPASGDYNVFIRIK